MLLLWPAAPPSLALATQALGRKSLGSLISWAGPTGSGPNLLPFLLLSLSPRAVQSIPLAALWSSSQTWQGGSNPDIPIFPATVPPLAHPEGLIPGGSEGCISSLVAESMAFPGGTRDEVRRVDSPLSSSLSLGPSEKEEGGSCPAPSENEREVGVMGRYQKQEAFACSVSQFCPCRCQARQGRHRPLLARAPALNCRGQFDMELTTVGQASSSFSSENSLGLEMALSPSPQIRAGYSLHCLKRPWWFQPTPWQAAKFFSLRKPLSHYWPRSTLLLPSPLPPQGQMPERKEAESGPLFPTGKSICIVGWGGDGWVPLPWGEGGVLPVIIES